MKQLKKSISTSIIELDLTDGTNTYMSNTNQTLKKNNEGEITYYITETELADITSSLEISNVVIANKATLYLINGSSESEYSQSNKTISVTKNGNTLTTIYKLKVVAEDTSVSTIYDIKFVILPVTDTFVLEYSDHTESKTYTYEGGTVDLVFTSINLPENLDLTPYITISKGPNSYNYLVNKTEFLTYFSYYTYGKYQVTNEDGDASIKFEVFQNLPAGTYTITVQIGSLSDSVTLIKTASTQCDILTFEFDNASVTRNGLAYSSNILFGRTFNQEDLEVVSGTNGNTIPNYLSKFTISPNATYEASASYEYTQAGLVVYTITYTITSESGNHKEYTHTLTERAPFTSGNTFASEFENGVTYTTTDPDYSLIYTTTAKDENNVLSSNSSIIISFLRNEGTPEFRTQYNLTNFYITSNNFTIEDVSDTYSSIGSGSGVAAISAPYAGITATITKACDVGTYVFRYTYNSSSTWGLETLNRTYIFPLIYITKKASTNSWIRNLSFIDGYIAQGATAAKIAYETALIPNENTVANRELYNYDEDELYYSNFSNTHGITFNTTGNITYTDKEISNSNYYILGNVSDASLASYAPTMTLDEYSEVYQYLTENKANGTYGANQETDDTSLLNTTGTDSIYLYLPYYVDDDGTLGESAADTYEIFLVKMEVVNGVKNLTEVYSALSGIYGEPDELGNRTKNSTVYNFTNLTLDKIHSDTNTFTASSKTYKISEACGKPSNSSLYMNYIGDPAEGHFWYVSYAVFSESYLKSTSDVTSVDYYHISIVDLTNNIYFTIKVNVPNAFLQNAIYMNINYVTYDNENNPIQSSVAVYAIESSEANVYLTQYQLSMLPSGYYTFTLELSPGYKVSYTANRPNKLGSNVDQHEGHDGAYLPPSSIVPIEIDLEFTVEVDQEALEASNKWGIGTSSTTTIVATFED